MFTISISIFSFQGTMKQKLNIPYGQNMMMMMKNCFVLWLTDERRLALFPAVTIVRDPHHCESPTCQEQILNLPEPEFRHC